MPNKIAIILHLYYPHMWEEIRDTIKKVDVAHDLYISTTRTVSCHMVPKIMQDMPDAHVRISENIGRDIAPFIAWISEIDLSQYDVICKIHSKLSPHIEDAGRKWGSELISDMLNNSKIIYSMFQQEQSVGIISSKKHETKGLGDTKEAYDMLCQLARINSDQEVKFFSGSMFWIKSEVAQRLKDLQINQSMFRESYMLCGTLAHALERFIATLSCDMGYKVRYTPLFRTRNYIKAKQLPLIRLDTPWLKTMCIYSTEYYGSHGEKLLRTSAIKPNYTYDLISKDLRQKHEDAARQIGIHGFCYEHIWNCGLPLFNSPLSLIIAEDCPNLPFCFHWITNGEFIHEKEDWTHHIHYLASFFKQKKYIKINDTPILMVNDVILEPKFNNMWIHMRSEAIKCGIKNFSTVSIENQFRIKINPDNIITLNNMLEKIDSFNNGFIIIEAWNKWVENRSLENSPKHIQAITQWIKDGGHNF